MKKSKQNYSTKYFETNIENLKNTWKGIKCIISLKHFASSSPNVMNFSNELTTDPLKIANVFNNYFSSIGEKLDQKQDFQIKITLTTFMVKIFNSFFINKKLFPLYPYSVITSLLVQIVHQQEY